MCRAENSTSQTFDALDALKFVCSSTIIYNSVCFQMFDLVLDVMKIVFRYMRVKSCNSLNLLTLE